MQGIRERAKVAATQKSVVAKSEAHAACKAAVSTDPGTAKQLIAGARSVAAAPAARAPPPLPPERKPAAQPAVDDEDDVLSEASLAKQRGHSHIFGDTPLRATVPASTSAEF